MRCASDFSRHYKRGDKQQDTQKNIPMETQYARNPVIDITQARDNNRKKEPPKENYSSKIQEYADWIIGTPLRCEQIQIEYDERRREQIRNYIYTEELKNNPTETWLIGNN